MGRLARQLGKMITRETECERYTMCHQSSEQHEWGVKFKYSFMRSECMTKLLP